MSAPGERAKALARGAKTYRGKPCMRGHGSLRFVANGNCVECNRLNYLKRAPELQKKWRAENPEKAREIGRRSEEKRRRSAEFESFIAAMTEEQGAGL